MAEAAFAMAVAGTAMDAYGSILQGGAAKEAADFEAAQLDQKATATEAIGTREAYEIRRKGKIIKGAHRLNRAASGFSSDAASARQEADIADAVKYQELVAIFNRDTEAQGYRVAADAARYGGEMAKRAGYRKAVTTVLSGGAKAAQMRT